VRSSEGERLLREAIREILTPGGTNLAPAAKGDDVTLTVDDPRMDAVDQALADMARISYAYMGCWAEVETPAGLRKKFTHFYVSDVDDDPDPDAGIYYTDWSGSKKVSVAATDGTPEGKMKLRDMMSKFFSQPGSWAEASGAPGNIMVKKLGLPTVNSEGEVRALLRNLPQEDIIWHGAHPDPTINYGQGWYTRTIRGRRATKIIVGNP
jgi:hypothetical protein